MCSQRAGQRSLNISMGTGPVMFTCTTADYFFWFFTQLSFLVFEMNSVEGQRGAGRCRTHAEPHRHL
ncbi:hypothetical protein KOW79_014371 [Hemibagrus wyckioides]|uniref:Uncharacterized protein n=1 Tax=Hemibagrus wyckioides TaxID=337641 RepID=A0A9D3SJA7_9TELE|nr:hypothetical protein KOW79_014371 [Hemibagrus wyckioides]